MHLDPKVVSSSFRHHLKYTKQKKTYIIYVDYNIISIHRQMLSDQQGADYNLIASALLLYSSLVFMTGFSSLIHSASYVMRNTSPLDVVVRIWASSSL